MHTCFTKNIGFYKILHVKKEIHRWKSFVSIKTLLKLSNDENTHFHLFNITIFKYTPINLSKTECSIFKK